MKKIKMIIMDVDGTLTDGKIYISTQGEIMKAFNVKDGLGIKKLQVHDIKPIIITGRNSEIVAIRARELGITEVHQGIHDKVKKLEQICEKYKYDFDEVAYIGDDENDLACMNLCGYKGCPQDAVTSVKDRCDFICSTSGGNGAVREFIEFLLHSQKAE